MKKYLVKLRIGSQLVKTVVYAENATHAHLLCQYRHGMDSVASGPMAVDEHDLSIDPLLSDSVKPLPHIKPLTPDQARIKSLKQGVQRSQQQLRSEQERQRRLRGTPSSNAVQ